MEDIVQKVEQILNTPKPTPTIEDRLAELEARVAMLVEAVAMANRALRQRGMLS